MGFVLYLPIFSSFLSLFRKADKVIDINGYIPHSKNGKENVIPPSSRPTPPSTSLQSYVKKPLSQNNTTCTTSGIPRLSIKKPTAPACSVTAPKQPATLLKESQNRRTSAINCIFSSPLNKKRPPTHRKPTTQSHSKQPEALHVQKSESTLSTPEQISKKPRVKNASYDEPISVESPPINEFISSLPCESVKLCDSTSKHGNENPSPEKAAVNESAELRPPPTKSFTSSQTCKLSNVPVLKPSVSSIKDPLLEAENYFLKLEIEKLKEQLKNSRPKRFSVEEIKDNERKIIKFTGFPNYTLLKMFLEEFDNVNDIKYKLKWKVVNIPRHDQILLTLMKLRLNMSHTLLADMFACCEATVTNIFVTWVNVIHGYMFKGTMSQIPLREKNVACNPSQFSSFSNCRIVLDCTEIQVTVPPSLRDQKKVYSNYKHRTTFKGLVGVSPHGVVTYASSLYPGSTSDKEIVSHSKVLDQLEPGDLVLADKGFTIANILPAGVSLNIPPFLNTPQFTPAQVSRTKKIARARIVVERSIGRVKRYKILDKIPQEYFTYSTKIWQVCALLSNWRFPLIKEVKEKLDKMKNASNEEQA